MIIHTLQNEHYTYSHNVIESHNAQLLILLANMICWHWPRDDVLYSVTLYFYQHIPCYSIASLTCSSFSATARLHFNSSSFVSSGNWASWWRECWDQVTCVYNRVLYITESFSPPSGDFLWFCQPVLFVCPLTSI